MITAKVLFVAFLMIGTMELSNEEKSYCESEGGCAVVTRKLLESREQAAYQRGLDEGRKLCSSLKHSDV